MKKFFLGSMLSFAALVALTACGGDKKATDANEEETGEGAPEETVAEETGYKPPFTIVAVHEDVDESINSGSRETWTITLLDNGMYKGHMKSESKDWRSEGRWYELKSMAEDFEGRWTVLYRQVGEGKQKVYDIHLKTKGLDGSIYLPDDCEYLYVGEWDNCVNFNTKARTAWKITEVLTGEEALKALEEPAEAEEEVVPGPPVFGKKYVCRRDDFDVEIEFDKEGDGVTFRNKPHSGYGDRSVPDHYKYEGNTIEIKFLQYTGKITPDGKQLVITDQFGESNTYNLEN